MFNAEKLLGGLIRGSTRGRRRGIGGLLSGGAALGVLGVAMEAVEHYMNQPQGGNPPPRPPAAPPPPPRPPHQAASSTAPPPPPAPHPPSAVPPPPVAAAPSGDAEAVVLIRAMIAAAHADGVIDEAERRTILERLQGLALSAEEHAFIVQELLAPTDMETIVRGVRTPEMAEQVYAVSLMAIEADTEQERRYLATLAGRLGLDSAAVERIQRPLAVR